MSDGYVVLDPDSWRVVDEEGEGTVRADPRLLDEHGDEAWISLSLGPPLSFDDPAVSGAVRRYLAGAPRRAVSTLLADATRYAGAVIVGDTRGEVLDDPFALVHERQLVHVGPGVFGRIPAPTGPGIARYRPGTAWPWDRF
jgi:hypothetical protein